MKTRLFKVLSAMAVVFAANVTFAAQDSYLYWMVDQNLKMNGSPVAATSWNYAKVNFGGSYLSAYNGGEAIATELESGAVSGGGTYWGKFDSSSAGDTPIIFELWSDSNSGNPYGYFSTTLAALSNYITKSSAGTASTPYSLTSVVPEPTSGLLMLLGVAGLALKRKRA